MIDFLLAGAFSIIVILFYHLAVDEDYWKRTEPQKQQRRRVMSIIDGLSKAIVHCDDSCDRAVLVDARYILDKLPKTADGVSVVPGMKVWFAGSLGPRSSEIQMIRVSPAGQHCDIELCFSTREAAEMREDVDEVKNGGES